MRHGTAMEVEALHPQPTAQSEIGFGISQRIGPAQAAAEQARSPTDAGRPRWRPLAGRAMGAVSGVLVDVLRRGGLAVIRSFRFRLSRPGMFARRETSLPTAMLTASWKMRRSPPPMSRSTASSQRVRRDTGCGTRRNPGQPGVCSARCTTSMFCSLYHVRLTGRLSNARSVGLRSRPHRRDHHGRQRRAQHHPQPRRAARRGCHLADGEPVAGRELLPLRQLRRYPRRRPADGSRTWRRKPQQPK